jgi:hypothetical protein
MMRKSLEEELTLGATQHSRSEPSQRVYQTVPDGSCQMSQMGDATDATDATDASGHVPEMPARLFATVGTYLT